MPDALLKWLLANPNAGIVAYLLITIAIVGWALYTEKLVLGKTWRVTVSKQVESDKLLAEVSERLTEQRLLNERSAAKLESQAKEILTLQLEVARLKGVVGRMERAPR